MCNSAVEVLLPDTQQVLKVLSKQSVRIWYPRLLFELQQKKHGYQLKFCDCSKLNLNV